MAKYVKIERFGSTWGFPRRVIQRARRLIADKHVLIPGVVVSGSRREVFVLDEADPVSIFGIAASHETASTGT